MENKKSEKKNGKKIAIAIIAVLLAAAGILCVWLLPKNAAEPEESPAPTESADPASPDSSKPGSTKPDNKPNASASPEASTAPTESATPAQSDNTDSNNTGYTGSSGNQQTGSTGNQNSGTQTGGHHNDDHHDEQEHHHSWQPVYRTVHHDEKGHYETVVVQAAWDEPEYESHAVCAGCGAWIENNLDHMYECGYGYSVQEFPTGNTIHHDEVTEQRWVVDTPAYDEQVVAGYKCSCGQEKLA